MREVAYFVDDKRIPFGATFAILYTIVGLAYFAVLIAGLFHDIQSSKFSIPDRLWLFMIVIYVLYLISLSDDLGTPEAYFVLIDPISKKGRLMEHWEEIPKEWNSMWMTLTFATPKAAFGRPYFDVAEEQDMQRKCEPILAYILEVFLRSPNYDATGWLCYPEIAIKPCPDEEFKTWMQSMFQFEC